MNIDAHTQRNLELIADHYGTDPGTVLQRLAAQTAARITDPDARPRDPSPLHFAEDTRRLVGRFLMEAGGDFSEAHRLMTEDIRRRYPGFRAKPGAPGYLEWDRLRQHIYSLKRKAKAAIQN